MSRLQGLTVDEAAWLVLMSEGRRKKSLSRLAMSDRVLDTLLERGSIVLKDGILEITDNGLAEVLRLTEPAADESTLPSTLRARARELGTRVTPIPQNRIPH
ncbi:MAG TPA: hypothetical protein VHQ92_17560 [Pseudolabrys sp.]|nr:hypothetical protein [Pseudolabrys sp.]